MSAYKRIECSLTDRDTLLKALGELGFEPAIHETPQRLRGYQGDARHNTAEIIVSQEQLNRSFTGASNDLGFLYNPTTKSYEMIVSDFDMSCKVNLRVIQAYAKVAIQKALEDQGFEVESTPTAAIQGRDRRDIQIVGEKLI
jgi:hypothetical protein